VLRVYDLQGRVVRVDTTTAAAYVTPEGMFQLGHSKDHRPDLPQVKIAMAVLDPLGVPLTTTIVAGNTADDPLYLPEIAKIRQIAGSRGLTYVGDCTMAAIGTRAEIVAHGDYYLCPLSAKQMPEADLARVLAPVWSGALEPRVLRWPTADGACDATDAPVALGFEYTVELHAPDHSEQPRTWQERRLVVRSLAWAARQEQSWLSDSNCAHGEHTMITFGCRLPTTDCSAATVCPALGAWASSLPCSRTGPSRFSRRASCVPPNGCW
jgi:hypothetical protein